MKNLLLILLVALGLQTQAQNVFGPAVCDSLNLDISITLNPLTDPNLDTAYFTPIIDTNFNVISYVWSFYELGVIPICPTMFYEKNPKAFGLPDTIYVCLEVCLDTLFPSVYCVFCDTFVRNGNNWAKIGIQQINYNPCDSISYSTGNSSSYPLSVHGFVSPTLNNDIDTVEFNWQVCDSEMCYSATGLWHYFGQISVTDTIKVCYDAYTYINGSIDTICSSCDWLIYDFNSYQWVLFNNSNPTAIQEITLEKTHNKVYDLLGREIIGYIPNNTVYIINNKKYIKIK